VESDNPTEEAMYGDLDITREGDGGSFRILFRPVGQNAAPAPGRLVESAEALSAVLRGLGLSDEQMTALRGGLENSSNTWLRLLAATAILKRQGLA